jgi:hypothetical protein
MGKALTRDAVLAKGNGGIVKGAINRVEDMTIAFNIC